MASVHEEIAALRGTRPATFKDLLTHPSFSRLWRAMLVSSLGDWVGFVAVLTLVTRLAGGTLVGLAVAGVMLARLLPSLVFGPFAGVVIDRFDRRKVMVAADIGRGSMYAVMPFLPALWMIFLLSFFIECLSLVWAPAKDASVPNLVPRRQLANANSVGLVTTYGTLPLGGVVYATLAAVAVSVGQGHYLDTHPEALALWMDALTFAFSARMVWGLDLPRGPVLRQGEGERLTLTDAFDDIRQGVRFLAEHPLTRAMTIGIVMGFAGAGAVIAVGPLYAGRVLGQPATGFGILMAALGVGMGLGMGLGSWFFKRVEKDRVFGIALGGSAVFLFVVASMPNIALAALFTVPTGAGAGLAWVSGYTILQENVSDEFRGRTFATLNTMVRLTLFVALVGFPALATAFGSHHYVHVGGTTLDFSGFRISLWLGGAVALAAGGMTRRGLRRQRVGHSRRLAIVPTLLRREQPGIFVAFEGVEGSGKGTQIELARAYVAERGHDVVVTREPGGTAFGDRLRGAVLDPSTGTLDPRAEALAFAASRAQLVADVIRPALAEGRVVLCDRFIDSSVAYQGFARGLGEQDILTLNAWATQGLFPDLVVLLDLEADAGLARAGPEPDRIEAEDRTFHTAVAEAYRRIAEEHPDRCVVVDATGTPQEVHERVRAALDRVLGAVEDRGSDPT